MPARTPRRLERPEEIESTQPRSLGRQVSGTARAPTIDDHGESVPPAIATAQASEPVSWKELSRHGMVVGVGITAFLAALGVYGTLTSKIGALEAKLENVIEENKSLRTKLDRVSEDSARLGAKVETLERSAKK